MRKRKAGERKNYGSKKHYFSCEIIKEDEPDAACDDGSDKERERE